MKKLGLLLFPILAITLMLGGNAFAQTPVGDNSIYFVTYYSNANTTGAPDSVLRLINDGAEASATVGTKGEINGTLYANIYVFDDSQEMRSCCSCAVTSDGLLSESVNKQLTSDEFTGRGEMTRGVIKVVSSTVNDPTCDFDPAPGLRGWMTHVQATTNIPEKGAWFVTETALADSNLSETEAYNLGATCSYGLTLGSGYGLCGCTVEDYDF